MTKVDPLSFDDPKSPRPHDQTPFDLGWGFCRWCAFLVPETDGKLTEHRFTRNGPADGYCTGSFRESTLPVPVEAEPMTQISLRKSDGRAGRRAYWQRRRLMYREGGGGTGEPRTGAEAFARMWMGLPVGDRSSGVIVDDYGEEVPDGDHTD